MAGISDSALDIPRTAIADNRTAIADTLVVIADKYIWRGRRSLTPRTAIADANRLFNRIQVIEL